MMGYTVSATMNRKAFVVGGALGLAICLTLMMIMPKIAWAQAKIVGTLELSCSQSVELGRIDVSELNISASPDQIMVGVPCGMIDMCGQDPCLCGAVDEYGACACNGTQTASAEIEVTSTDEGVVKPVNAFGAWHLVAMGSGNAQVNVKGHIAHYKEGSQTVEVHVRAFSIIDAFKMIVPLAAVVAVVLFLRKLMKCRR